MAMRHSGGTITRFSRTCPINPRKKQPVKLISSVPYGNVLPILICTSPCSPYLASVPAAPNAPIRNKRNVSPIRLLSPHSRKNSWCRLAARSHQPRRTPPGRLWRTPSPRNCASVYLAPQTPRNFFYLQFYLASGCWRNASSRAKSICRAGDGMLGPCPTERMLGFIPRSFAALFAESTAFHEKRAGEGKQCLENTCDHDTGLRRERVPRDQRVVPDVKECQVSRRMSGRRHRSQRANAFALNEQAA